MRILKTNAGLIVIMFLVFLSVYFLSHFSLGKVSQAVSIQPPTWINGDFHIHTGATETSTTLLSKIKNLNINVGHVLIWGLYQAYDGGNFLGQNNDPVSEANNILRWDVEISLLPGHYNGHMVMLNIADPNAITATTVGYPGQDYLFPNLNYVQSTGGLVGYDHADAWLVGDFGTPVKGTIRPYELPLDTALGKVDFLGTQDVSSPKFYWLWYQMLNAGFHIAPVTGSDSPNHSSLGSVQTAVALDASTPFTFQNYIEAVRQGKTVIRRTTAVPDYLDIRINDTGIGGDVNVPAGTTNVIVEIDARSATNSTVDVVVNGIVYQTVNITDSLNTYTISIPITKSSWIAVRTPDAHTASIFVLVGGKAIRNDPTSALQWRDYLERYYNWGITETREDGQKIFGASASIIRTKVDEAKAIWATIAEEGGPVAPGNFQFSATNYPVSEGIGTAVVTVTRVGGSTGTISVGYGDWYGTSIPPTRGVDYQPVHGVLTFPDGVTSQTVSIPIFEDSIQEPNEFFQLWLFNPSSGSSVMGGPSTVTIMDNDTVTDTVPPTISNIMISSITLNSVTVNWATNELADSQVEYGLTTSYGTSTTLNSTMITNHAVALDSLSAGTMYNYRVKSRDSAGNLSVSGNGTFTTASNTSPGNFQFNPVNYSISEAAGTAIVTVTRVGGSTGTISVGYGDWYGTSIPPTRGVDYQSVHGVLTFPDGVTSQTIFIPIFEDSIQEPNEFFQLWLFTPSSGSSITGVNPALITIVDND